MEFQELIKERYSCRKFSERPVEADKLEAVLEAGRIAPTAANRQPQRILVVQGEAARKKMEECTTCSFDAPVILVCCYDREKAAHNKLGDGHGCGHEDVSIVMTLMMLACFDLGLGNTWVGLMREDKLHELFNIPQTYEIVGLMPIGYPAEDAKPANMHFRRKPLEETVFYDTF